MESQECNGTWLALSPIVLKVYLLAVMVGFTGSIVCAGKNTLIRGRENIANLMLSFFLLFIPDGHNTFKKMKNASFSFDSKNSI